MPDSNIIMYTTEDGLTKIEITFENDTVWLSIDYMAELFQRDKKLQWDLLHGKMRRRGKFKKEIIVMSKYI